MLRLDRILFFRVAAHLLGALALCAYAGAEVAPSLFHIAPTKADTSAAFRDVGGMTSAVEAVPDLDFLRSNPSRFSFSLPDGRVYEAVQDRFSSGDGERFHWGGYLYPSDISRSSKSRSGDTAGFASLTFAEGLLAASFKLPDGGSYRLLPELGGARYGLLRIAPSSHRACGTETPRAASLSPLKIPQAPAVAEASAELKAASCISPTPVSIGVMIVYVDQLAMSAAQETDTRLKITAAFNDANYINARSGVGLTYHLAYLGRIPGTLRPSNVSLQSAMNWAHQQLGISSSAMSSLRLTSGGDLVSVAVPLNTSDATCGLAILPQCPDGSSTCEQEIYNLPISIFDRPYSDQAIMTFELTCGDDDYTFAHELGHTLGMNHERSDPATDVFNPVLHFAYGHVFGQRASLMACNSAGSGGGATCHRAPNISNPDIDFGGLPTGTIADNNACVARLRAEKYAQFRVSPGHPRLNLLEPSEGDVIAPNTPFRLRATATDLENVGIQNFIEWRATRVSDGVVTFLGTGPDLFVQLPVEGLYDLNASVTDTDQNTASHTITININEDVAPPLMRFDRPFHQQVVSGVIPVRGWVTDASGATEVSFTINGQALSIPYGTSRPDVCSVHANLDDPNCPNVGFDGTLNTVGLHNGLNILRVTAADAQGTSRTISRRFTVENLTTVTFTPTDDTWVWQQQPRSNFGRETALYTRAATTGQGRSTYIKFDVTGLTRLARSAKLRLRTLGTPFPSSRIYWISDNSWTELSIGWYTAPTSFYRQWALGAQPANSWIEIDVSDIVRVNQDYTFGFTAADAANLGFHSRESAHPPELVVTY